MAKFQSQREKFTDLVQDLQAQITSSLEQIDGKAVFRIDDWEREGFGFGSTRVIEKGRVFEKGGVNVSAVAKRLPKELQESLDEEESDFFATGISIVIHPVNPFVPTVHANYRYFELYDKDTGEMKDQWFGGGADLTPYYLFEEDAVHFHKVHKEVCDRTHPEFYDRFKKWCDEYFYNHHRNESRGIGGIFYDHIRPSEEVTADDLYEFAKNAGEGFLKAYLPIVKRRMNMEYDESHRKWQEVRRGRYVEFNLIHDRGTLFGLKTKGRIESILMSLPPHVQWIYDHHPKPESEEAKLVMHLKAVDWLNYSKDK